MGTNKLVENTIISVIYKKLVTNIIEKFIWLKSQENVLLYSDTRAFMNYVNVAHGGVFRRVVLGAMIESTQNIIKTQCRVEQGNQ